MKGERDLAAFPYIPSLKRSCVTR